MAQRKTASRKASKKASAKRTPKRSAKRATAKKGAKRATAKKGVKRATAKKGVKRATAKKGAARAGARKAKAPGRPGTAGKAEGHDAVLALIARQRPDLRAILERIDAIVLREVPDARCAIKWSSPMYGVAGKGWFLGTAAFKNNVGVSFFEGIRLKPEPSFGESKQMRGARYATMADLDEKQLADWVRQASSLQGWGKA